MDVKKVAKEILNSLAFEEIIQTTWQYQDCFCTIVNVLQKHINK